jgi:hypothetical protein
MYTKKSKVVQPPLVISVDEPTDVDMAIAETMIDIKEEYDLMTEEVEKSTTDKRIQKWWQILTKNR